MCDGGRGCGTEEEGGDRPYLPQQTTAQLIRFKPQPFQHPFSSSSPFLKLSYYLNQMVFFPPSPLPSLSLHSQAGPLLFSCPGDWAGIDWRSCQLFEQCAVVALSVQLCLQGAPRSSLSATCAAQVDTLSKLQDHSSNTLMRPQTLGKHLWTRYKVVNFGIKFASGYPSQ